VPAESFDRSAFEARLATRRLGRALIVRASAASTNDVAWDALAEGLPDGTAAPRGIFTDVIEAERRAEELADKHDVPLHRLSHAG
jgi:hypothetical protein